MQLKESLRFMQGEPEIHSVGELIQNMFLDRGPSSNVVKRRSGWGQSSARKLFHFVNRLLFSLAKEFPQRKSRFDVKYLMEHFVRKFSSKEDAIVWRSVPSGQRRFDYRRFGPMIVKIRTFELAVETRSQKPLVQESFVGVSFLPEITDSFFQEFRTDKKSNSMAHIIAGRILEVHKNTSTDTDTGKTPKFGATTH